MPTILSPRLWGAHVLALVLVASAGMLGLWQYHAWQERRSAEASDLTQLAPVPLDSVIGPDDPFPGDKVGQPVSLDGTWVPTGTVYVSGRAHEGTDGYWVVTPLAIGSPDGSALPVVRGWVADPADAPAPPTGAGRLDAWLQPTEGDGSVDDDPNDDVLPQLRIADVIQHVDQDLYGAYAVAEQGVGGLTAADLAQLPSAGRFTALRNLLYAFEWLVFGAFAAFIWWRWMRDLGQARAEGEDEPVPEPEDDPVPSEP